MRWDNLRLGHEDPPPELGEDGKGRARALALVERGAVERTIDTPEFRGVTFYEIQARSIVNRVPGASAAPFRWTLNPYRGCTHACVYCFARNSHTYLDLDAGRDFDTKVVVKVNAAQLLRRELSARRWAGEHIAIGANVDCYQRAEGRYQLMRGILRVLAERRNPFSILTKGTLILRDLDLLTAAAERADVGLNVSVGFVDRELHREVEPGTPPPAKRLEVCRTLTETGLGCGVVMGPILPFLSDSREQLEQTVAAAAAAGARHITPIVLHLRPGTREWYLAWLAEHEPRLVPRYRELYGGGAYADKEYQRQIAARVRVLARRHGLAPTSPERARRVDEVAPPAEAPPAGGLGEELSSGQLALS